MRVRYCRYVASLVVLAHLSACAPSPIVEASLVKIDKVAVDRPKQGGNGGIIGGGGGGAAGLVVTAIAAGGMAVADALSADDAQQPQFGYLYSLRTRDGKTLTFLQPNVDNFEHPEAGGFVPQANVAIEHIGENLPAISCAKPLAQNKTTRRLPTLRLMSAKDCSALLKRDENTVSPMSH